MEALVIVTILGGLALVGLGVVAEAYSGRRRAAEGKPGVVQIRSMHRTLFVLLATFLVIPVCIAGAMWMGLGEGAFVACIALAPLGVLASIAGPHLNRGALTLTDTHLRHYEPGIDVSVLLGPDTQVQLARLREFQGTAAQGIVTVRDSTAHIQWMVPLKPDQTVPWYNGPDHRLPVTSWGGWELYQRIATALGESPPLPPAGASERS